MPFTLLSLSIRRRVHMPCVRDAATFSCRHRPAACRPCPPPCPVLSSPVPPAGPSRLQSSPPPAASFSGARPQKLADRAAMVGSSVLYGMDGRSARPKGKAKVNGSRTVGHGTAHLCSPALRLLLLLPPPPPAHGRTLLRSFHPFLAQRQTMLLCASHPTLIMNFCFREQHTAPTKLWAFAFRAPCGACAP